MRQPDQYDYFDPALSNASINLMLGLSTPNFAVVGVVQRRCRGWPCNTAMKCRWDSGMPAEANVYCAGNFVRFGLTLSVSAGPATLKSAL
jgi:hypothetical protein